MAMVVMTGAACATARAAVEDATSAAKSFSLYTLDGTYSLQSDAEVAAWPVTWRTGDTVTAQPALGESETLVTDAASAGSKELTHKGGIWTVESELSGTVRVAVPWSVFGDGGDLAASAAAAGKIDTYQTGPDRSVLKRNVPPVSYTGDNWVMDASAASSLKFTSPSGTETTVDLTGTGGHSFTFDEDGVWTVLLTMADETTLTAHLNILGGGLIIIIR